MGCTLTYSGGSWARKRGWVVHWPIPVNYELEREDGLCIDLFRWIMSSEERMGCALTYSDGSWARKTGWIIHWPMPVDHKPESEVGMCIDLFRRVLRSKERMGGTVTYSKWGWVVHWPIPTGLEIEREDIWYIDLFQVRMGCALTYSGGSWARREDGLCIDLFWWIMSSKERMGCALTYSDGSWARKQSSRVHFLLWPVIINISYRRILNINFFFLFHIKGSMWIGYFVVSVATDNLDLHGVRRAKRYTSIVMWASAQPAGINASFLAKEVYASRSSVCDSTF